MCCLHMSQKYVVPNSQSEENCSNATCSSLQFTSEVQNQNLLYLLDQYYASFIYLKTAKE